MLNLIFKTLLVLNTEVASEAMAPTKAAEPVNPAATVAESVAPAAVATESATAGKATQELSGPDPAARLREISFSHPVDSRVELASASADIKLIRMRPMLGSEALVRYVRDGVEPVLQIELAVRATGAIESFRVLRPDVSEVFRVLIESNQLKFVRQRAESSSFPTMLSGYIPFASTLRDTLDLLSKKNSDQVNEANQKVLRALRVISESEPAASSKKAVDVNESGRAQEPASGSADSGKFLDLVDADLKDSSNSPTGSSDQPKL
jgi:hypothetical protein